MLRYKQLLFLAKKLPSFPEVFLYSNQNIDIDELSEQEQRVDDNKVSSWAYKSN